MGKPVTNPRNEEWMRAEQERRRSNVATPHRNRKKYRRKVKHKGRSHVESD